MSATIEHRKQEAKVSDSCALVNGEGTEGEDNGWISVDGRGDRVQPDLAIDLRPIGVKSKF
jgi:hypothetical protein